MLSFDLKITNKVTNYLLITYYLLFIMLFIQRTKYVDQKPFFNYMLCFTYIWKRYENIEIIQHTVYKNYYLCFDNLMTTVLANYQLYTIL